MSAPLPPSPAGHTARRALFQGVGIAVDDFRCARTVGLGGEDEPSPAHSIVFVRRGAFRRTSRRRTLLADPNHVLFFNAGQAYRYEHPVPGGDDCTILGIDPRVARSAVAFWSPRDADSPEGPFRAGHVLSTPRAARLHFELFAGLPDEGAALATEDRLVALVDEVLGAAYRRPAPPETLRSTGSRRRRDLVESAREILIRQPEAPLRLTEMASQLGCSPFHLSRIFRRETGVSLRAYLQALRTRLAADRLTRGASDLTALALDLGFADHSHFTNAFRREWGVAPSRLRARALPRSARKNVQAD